jgi:ribosome-associated protein
VPDALPVRAGLTIPGDELHETASRAGGPGGQNVQKTSTRVSLRWSLATSRALDPALRARLLARLCSRLTRDGELLVHAEDTRSQAQNRALARARLAALVRAALVERRPRRPTRPGRAARARRVDTKRARGEAKQRRRRVRPRADDPS